MRFGESLGQARRRVRTEGPRKPLRTFKELCADLGEPERHVLGKLARDEGRPEPVLVKRTRRGQASWYDPEQFRAWWGKANAQ